MIKKDYNTHNNRHLFNMNTDIEVNIRNNTNLYLINTLCPDTIIVLKNPAEAGFLIHKSYILNHKSKTNISTKKIHYVIITTNTTTFKQFLNPKPKTNISTKI